MFRRAETIKIWIRMEKKEEDAAKNKNNVCVTALQ